MSHSLRIDIMDRPSLSTKTKGQLHNMNYLLCHGPYRKYTIAISPSISLRAVQWGNWLFVVAQHGENSESTGFSIIANWIRCPRESYDSRRACTQSTEVGSKYRGLSLYNWQVPHIMARYSVFSAFHSEDFINREYVETIMSSQIRQLYRSSASNLAKFVKYDAPLPVVLRRWHFTSRNSHSEGRFDIRYWSSPWIGISWILLWHKLRHML